MDILYLLNLLFCKYNVLQPLGIYQATGEALSPISLWLSVSMEKELTKAKNTCVHIRL